MKLLTAKSRWLSACRTIVAAFAALVAAVSPAQAQPVDIIGEAQKSLNPFGFEIFHAMIQRKDLHTISEYKSWRPSVGFDPLTWKRESRQSYPASERLLVIMGDCHQLPFDEHLLEKFVEYGGAVLIATDRGDNGLLEPFGAKLSPGPVRLPKGSPHAFRQQLDCPLVTSFLHMDRIAPFPPLSKVKALATNKPGYFSYAGSHPDLLWPRAFFPPDLFDEEENRLGRTALLAVGRNMEGGRIIAVSDHSLFINQMILPGVADNAQFAFGCVDWLCENGKRKYLHFIVDGVPLQPLPFELPFPDELPDIPPEAILPFINSVISSFQKENVFNQVISQLQQELDPTAIPVFVTVALICFAGLWLLVARAAPPAGRQFVTSVPLYSRRHQEVVDDGRLGQTAQRLGRQFFESLADAARSVPDWQKQPPRIAHHDATWAQQWRTNRMVRKLWSAATASTDRAVNARQLRGLIADMEQLKSGLAAGKLHLVWPAA